MTRLAMPLAPPAAAFAAGIALAAWITPRAAWGLFAAAVAAGVLVIVLGQSAHAPEIVDGAERPLPLPHVDDARGECRTDAGQALELRGAREIHVERCGVVTARPARPGRVASDPCARHCGARQRCVSRAMRRARRLRGPRRERRRRARAVEGLEIRDRVGVGAAPAVDAEPARGDRDDREQHDEMASRIAEHVATIAREAERR